MEKGRRKRRNHCASNMQCAEVGAGEHVGSVAVKVMAGDAVTVARTLRAGKSFGELALLQKGGLRSASVVSCGITSTEFLTIAADQYEQLLSNLHQAEIRSKVDVVRHCKIFRYISITCSFPELPRSLGTESGNPPSTFEVFLAE